MFDHTHFADLLPEVFAALLVAGVGLFQWRRKHPYPGRSAGQGTRQKAAESLWAKLEDVNFGMRETTTGSSHQDMSARLQDLNAALRKKSPYLEESVQATVSAYVRTLQQVADLLRDNEAPTAVEWVDTAILPIASGNPTLLNALQDLARQREIVKGVLLRAAS